MYDPGTLYIDPILTNFALGYRAQNYYADVLFPINRVNTKSGKYRVFDRSDWQIFPDRREPGTVANEVRGRKWSVDTFATKQHALQSPVLDEERRELASLGGLGASPNGAALDINPERDATTLITRSLQLGHEKKVADLARNTASYPVGNTVTLAGAQQFDDYTGGTASTSDPTTVIKTAVRKIQNKTGFAPNLMMIPSEGVSYVEDHPRVTARFSNFTLSDPEAWRTLSGFRGRIVEVDSRYNAADNIDATENIQSFWGKDIILAYVDDSDDMVQATFAKTFVYPQPNGDDRPVDTWREEARKADLFRTMWEYDLKIVMATAGYLIKNAFSAGAW